MVRMTATEASRGFSELLGRVAAGEQVEITRSGTPIAVVSPARGRMLSAERFEALMASLPEADPDFVDDVRAIRREAGDDPSDPWAS